MTKQENLPAIADAKEEAAKAIFDVLCPGLEYTADDAFWYRRAAEAALRASPPAQPDLVRALEEARKRAVVGCDEELLQMIDAALCSQSAQQGK